MISHRGDGHRPAKIINPDPLAATRGEGDGSWRTPRLASRGAVAPFIAMDVMARAAALETQGRPIMHMEVGQPCAPAPGPVLEAARTALVDGRLGYTEARGIPRLRAAIQAHYQEIHGLAIDETRIMVTAGSSAGFNLAFLAAFEPGDRLAIARPGYPAYRNIATALGLDVVLIETRAADNWALDPERLRAAHRAQPLAGVLVASPANPTGMLTPDTTLHALVETCRKLGLWFISDEIYHGLAYGSTATSALALSDDVIAINSFSKYYCMTGWRIGWMVVPQRLARHVEILGQSLYISAPDLSQRASVHAFEPAAIAELEQVKAGYARNRATLLSALPTLGFRDVLSVDGGFYIYAGTGYRKERASVGSGRGADVLAIDSTALARRLLEEAGVAVTPGKDFDPIDGDAYIRFSFAGAPETIDEALSRIDVWRHAAART